MDKWMMGGWVWPGIEGASYLDPARSLLHILYMYPGSNRAMSPTFPAFGVSQTNRQYDRQYCVHGVAARVCASS